jgi:threonine synthase
VEIALGASLNLFLKIEGLNPTGSFKDRGMTAAISQALSDGAETVICARSGNTAASSAVYAAKADLRTLDVIPRGKIAQGKLAAALAHGAEVVSISGSFDDGLEIVRQIAKKKDR